MTYSKIAATIAAAFLMAFAVPTQTKAQCGSNLVLDSVVFNVILFGYTRFGGKFV